VCVSSPRPPCCSPAWPLGTASPCADPQPERRTPCQAEVRPRLVSGRVIWIRAEMISRLRSSRLKL
jgi:hypothetical protein